MKKFICILLSVLLVLSAVNVNAASFKPFGQDIDYTNPNNASIGPGSNIHNTNYTEGVGFFPFEKAWEPKNVGYTLCKPVIVDDYIITLGNHSVIVVDLKSGQLLKQYTLPKDYPLSLKGSVFVIKKADAMYQIIALDDFNVISVQMAASESGLNFSVMWRYSNLQSSHMMPSKFVTSGVALMEDAATAAPYISFGTYNGDIIVLNSQTGALIQDGKVSYSGSLGSSAPVIVPAYGKNSELVVSSSRVINGFFAHGLSADGMFGRGGSVGVVEPFDIKIEDMKGPVAYYLGNDYISGTTQPIIISQTASGSIVGINPITNVVQFKVNPYNGFKSVRSFSVKGKYLLAVLNETQSNRSSVVCIDLDKAIQEGQTDSHLANSSVVFKTGFAGEIIGGAHSFSVVENGQANGQAVTNVFHEVFAAAVNKGGNAEISLFYLDKYEGASQTAIKVPYAFKVEESTSDTLSVPGGISSEITIAAGYLVFVDGKGRLNAYTAKKSENLALVNLQNSGKVLEKGKTYETIVDIVNYTGRDITAADNVPLEFYINDTLVNSTKVTFGPEGVTSKFRYTVPESFTEGKIKITAKINMVEQGRKLSETTYDDNVVSIDLTVASDVDLAVTDVQYPKYPAGKEVSAVVTVYNNSDSDVYDVPVQLTIAYAGGSASKAKTASIPAKKSTQVLFNFTTPSTSATLQMTGEVNRTRIYKETTYANNSKTLTAQVVTNTYDTNCYDVREWSEWDWRWETRTRSYTYEEEVIDPVTGKKVIDPLTGQVVKVQKTGYENYSVQVWYEFWYRANVSITSVSITPQTLKSGYGFGVSVTSNITYGQISGQWSRSPVNKPSAASYCTIKVPFGRQVYPMEVQSTSGLTTVFRLPIEQSSVLKDRKIYTPVELPGTKKKPETYPVVITISGSSVPSGDLCVSQDSSITINGNMYEDDWTSGK